MKKKIDNRKMFFEVMEELVEHDDSYIVLTGDLGYSFYENFAQKYPNNFINCGCIEQSMLGIAAGLWHAGKKPIVYSGSIFALMRPYEQIRDDIAYMNLGVKIIGTGASSFLGHTHNYGAYENEANLIDPLPNISLDRPKNKTHLKEILSDSYPRFIRI